MRVRLALICLLTLCGLTVPGGVAEARGVPPMVETINKVRRSHGLPGLRYSASLARSSTGFARHLMRGDWFGHAGHIGASGRFSRVGEVLALQRGWRPRRGRVVRRWLRSPSHSSVLLSRRYRYVGAGRSRGRFGGRLTTIWVVQFGGR